MMKESNGEESALVGELARPAIPPFVTSSHSTGSFIFSNNCDFYSHDQLPDVEEVRTRAAVALSKAEVANRETKTRLRVRISPNVLKWLFWIGLLVMIVVIISLAVGLSKSGSSSSANSIPLNRTQVEEFLMTNGIATREQLANDASPQWMAVSWLTQLDGAGREPVPLEGDNTVYFLQRYILVLLYYATGGPYWIHSRNLARPDLKTCQWNTQATNSAGKTFDLGAMCSDGSIVDKIQIPWTNLRGEIPRELGYLTNLSFLALNDNQLQDFLPTELQRLTNLDYLALQSNELIGSIPDWLDQLSLLRVLGLGSNLLTGTLPTAMDALRELVTLGLDDNTFSGDLQNLENLVKMKRLYLNDNGFSTPLATTHLLAMRELEELDLSSNTFTGTVPLDLFKYTALRILDLNGNSLTGDLPQGDYDHAQSMTYLALNSNELTGPIPEGIGSLTDLTHLDLSGNQFTGLIPGSIQFLVHLKYLFLANNPLMTPSPIPDQYITKLTNLEDLSLKNTYRTGAIPDLTVLRNLVLLDLDKNDLTGEVPMELSKLTKLQYLFLNRNGKLAGQVPSDVQLLPDLRILLLSGTSMSGGLDHLCNRASPLSAVEVASADCSGDTPELVCTCCSICCADGTTADTNSASQPCTNTVYFGEIDPNWKDSFERTEYKFGISNESL